MNFYFLSDALSHLKIDGEYAGTIFQNAKKLTLSTAPSLVEFLPCRSEFSPVTLSQNVENPCILKVKNGVLYYPRFFKKPSGIFKVISQKNYNFYGGELTLTVTEDLIPKFYLDGSFYFLSSLPFIPDSSNVEFYGDYAFVSFYKKKTALFIFRISDGKQVYFDLVDNYRVSEVLTVEKSYKNVTKTTVLERWNLTPTVHLLSVSDEKQKPLYSLNEKLLPLAFFENAVIGGDVKDVVTAEFSKNAEKLREFLGKIRKVIPSLLGDGAVWLIQDGKVSEATLSIKNGLIDNVFLEDF